MRSARIIPALGAAGLAAALLVACGGGSRLAPLPLATVAPGSAAGIASPGIVGPTPFVPASPMTVPTPTVSSSPVGGLASPSPIPT